MAITTLDQLIAAAKERIEIVKTVAVTTVAAQPFSLWDVAGSPGAGSLAVGNTANGLVPTDATAGAPGIAAFGGGATGYLQLVAFSSTVAGRLVLYDRLFHAGSFAMTPLQTFNLTAQPDFSARLPGGSFEGLELFLEINAGAVSAATTVLINYRNQADADENAIVTASLSGFTTRRLVRIALAAGAKGVKRINSVTTGGTLSATGTFNVVIARRLWANRAVIAGGGGLDGPERTGMEQIYDNSCLWLVAKPDSTSAGVPEVSCVISNG